MTPLQYEVTREAGTERSTTGKYNTEKREGIFQCSSCGQKLFESSTKYESGTGWPSFFKVISEDNISLKSDASLIGATRTEVVCKRCNSHLGHLFKDGPKPTGLRYCINSVSLIHSADLKK